MDPEKWCRSDFKLKMIENHLFLFKEDMARKEKRENEARSLVLEHTYPLFKTNNFDASLTTTIGDPLIAVDITRLQKYKSHLHTCGKPPKLMVRLLIKTII